MKKTILLTVLSLGISSAYASNLSFHRGDLFNVSVSDCDKSEWGGVFVKYLKDGSEVLGASCEPKICNYRYEYKNIYFVSEKVWSISLEPEGTLLGKGLTTVEKDQLLSKFLADKTCKKTVYHPYQYQPSL